MAASEWTDGDEALLERWRRSALGYRFMHKVAVRRYELFDRGLKIPAIVLNTAVCTSLLTERDPGDVVVYAAAACSLAAAICTGLDQFLDFRALAVRHQTLAETASHLLADVSAQLALPRGRRMSPDGFLEKCFEAYDQLLQDSTTLPTAALGAFRRHVADHGFVREEDALGASVRIPVRAEARSAPPPNITAPQMQSTADRTAR